MLAYALQIGTIAAVKPRYSQSVYADSLGEAIVKAKAIVRTRPLHTDETNVRICENDANGLCLWSSTVHEVREG